ncbi:MAG: LysR family transcriptional regulator [Oscillospiraceae bacterium]|jgi:DNA-binding transcriptional LysR family regulator
MNNLLHLKYAVEVEKTGSISKAAENLYMGQPQISKAIREIESSLGISIFNRTSKGVIPTKKGAEFLSYARNILSQVKEMESLYQPADPDKQAFDISVPRASYVSYAFTELIQSMDHSKEINVNYRETHSLRAIRNVADGTNNLAVVRYQSIYEEYYLNLLKERKLTHDLIWEFEYLALMSRAHPLASQAEIDYHDLFTYTEIIHGDILIPTLPISGAKLIEPVHERKRKIAVYERGSQFELLYRIPGTYMWVSPMPPDVLSCFSLVQKKCNMAKNKYKDILICRKGYSMRQIDEMFIQKLHESVDLVSRL